MSKAQVQADNSTGPSFVRQCHHPTTEGHQTGQAQSALGAAHRCCSVGEGDRLHPVSTCRTGAMDGRSHSFLGLKVAVFTAARVLTELLAS